MHSNNQAKPLRPGSCNILNTVISNPPAVVVQNGIDVDVVQITTTQTSDAANTVTSQPVRMVSVAKSAFTVRGAPLEVTYI